MLNCVFLLFLWDCVWYVFGFVSDKSNRVVKMYYEFIKHQITERIEVWWRLTVLCVQHKFRWFRFMICSECSKPMIQDIWKKFNLTFVFCGNELPQSCPELFIVHMQKLLSPLCRCSLARWYIVTSAKFLIHDGCKRKYFLLFVHGEYFLIELHSACMFQQTMNCALCITWPCSMHLFSFCSGHTQLATDYWSSLNSLPPMDCIGCNDVCNHLSEHKRDHLNITAMTFVCHL